MYITNPCIKTSLLWQIGQVIYKYSLSIRLPLSSAQYTICQTAILLYLIPFITSRFFNWKGIFPNLHDLTGLLVFLPALFITSGLQVFLAAGFLRLWMTAIILYMWKVVDVLWTVLAYILKPVWEQVGWHHGPGWVKQHVHTCSLLNTLPFYTLDKTSNARQNIQSKTKLCKHKHSAQFARKEVKTYHWKQPPNTGRWTASCSGRQ